MHVWSARPKQPYPGLRPFQPDEWSIFFGRETIIDDVIERLATQRVVLIHGASGSGKSSLVLAGVMPRLARQHLRHGVSWITCAMRPSGGPLWNLAREFARIEGREDDPDRIGHIIRLFNKRDATLGNVVNSLPGLKGKRLCILVDQFEELFRFERETSREEAELFVQLLIGEIATADDDDPNARPPLAGPDRADIHIAITMRSEFLGECARFDGFAEAVNRTQYLVPRLRYEALLRAIQRPAELYGGEVTVELAKRLVADVRGRDDELPLIQHGLMLLWNAAANASDQPIILDVAQFEHAGGLTKLLSDHAERVMASVSLPGSSSPAVERLFRALTDINAEGRAIRRPQSFRELVAICDVTPQDLHRIINAFRADGVSFLTPYFPTMIGDKTIIDISHEALIRCWNRIADPQTGWLRREFQDGLIWRALLNDAKGFESDRTHILSPAATNQRMNWFAERNPAWSERYGGNWDSVTKLLQASRRVAMRSVRRKRLLLTAVFYLAAAGGGLIVAEQFESAKDWIIAASAILVFPTIGLLYFFLIQLAVDYIRQYIPSKKIRRLAVWSALLVSACSSMISWYSSDVPQWISVTLTVSLVLAAFIAVVWLIMAVATFLLKYIPLPPRVVRFIEIEPTIAVRRQRDLGSVLSDEPKAF